MSRQNILTIILALTLIAGGYVWYSYFSAPATDIAVEEDPSMQVSPQFLEIAALLDRIDIDSEFFKSTKFQELQAGAKLPPLPELRGRQNPFGGI